MLMDIIINKIQLWCMCVCVCVIDCLGMEVCACVSCHDKLITGWFNYVYTVALVVFTVYDTGSGVCVCVCTVSAEVSSMPVNFNPHQGDL